MLSQRKALLKIALNNACLLVKGKLREENICISQSKLTFREKVTIYSLTKGYTDWRKYLNFRHSKVLRPW